MEAHTFEADIFDIEEHHTVQVKKVFELLKQSLQDIAHIKEYSSKQDCKSIRKLKITEISYATERINSKFIPFIRLTGRWLEKANFKPGEYAQVITIKGMVLIVPLVMPEVDGGEMV
jgi:hypothetical protein